MAYLYRLFVLFIALFLSLPSLAISNDDEPGKSVPPKVRGDRPNLPHVPAIAGKPIKLPVVSPLPWSRLINPTGPDPIRFTIRASKDSIAIGEEFEITITAELLDIAPQSMFFFEEQKSFSLKVLTPEGFQQTGGSYHDLIDETLTPSNPHRSYTIRGQYHADLKSLHFTLLRGPKNATSASLYEKKKELDIFLKKNSKGDVDSIEQSANARVAKPEICRFEVVPGSLTSVNGVYKGEVRKVCSTQTDNAVSGQPNCLPGQGYCKGSSLEYHSNLCGNGLDTQYWYDISTGSLVFLGQAQNNSGFLLPLTRNYQIIIWCEPLSEIPANWLPMNIYSFDCGSAPTLRLKPISCDVANAQPLSATERVIQVVGGNYSSLDLLLGNPYNGTAVTLSASQKELVITNPNYTYVYGFYTPTITGTEACDMNLPKLNIEGISLPPRSPLQVYNLKKYLLRSLRALIYRMFVYKSAIESLLVVTRVMAYLAG